MQTVMMLSEDAKTNVLLRQLFLTMKKGSIRASIEQISKIIARRHAEEDSGTAHLKII
jgi:hypothetical protein